MNFIYGSLAKRSRDNWATHKWKGMYCERCGYMQIAPILKPCRGRRG